LEYPIVHFIILSRAPRIRNLVFGIILVNKVLLDASGLKQVDGLAVGECVSQSGDAPIGVDGEEPWLFLLVFGEGDFGVLVGHAELFEGYGNLDAVGCLGCVKVDVGTVRHFRENKDETEKMILRQ
jgi:hypothetical protein